MDGWMNRKSDDEDLDEYAHIVPLLLSLTMPVM